MHKIMYTYLYLKLTVYVPPYIFRTLKT